MSRPERCVLARCLRDAKDLALKQIHHPLCGVINTGSALFGTSLPNGTLFTYPASYGLLKADPVIADRASANPAKADKGWYFHTTAYTGTSISEERALQKMEDFWVSNDVGSLDCNVVRDNILSFLSILGCRAPKFLRAARLDDFKTQPFKLTMTNLYLEARRRITANIDEFDDILVGNVLFDMMNGTSKRASTFSDLCVQIAMEAVTDPDYFTDECPVEHEMFLMRCDRSLLGIRFWED